MAGPPTNATKSTTDRSTKDKYGHILNGLCENDNNTNIKET